VESTRRVKTENLRNAANSADQPLLIVAKPPVLSKDRFVLQEEHDLTFPVETKEYMHQKTTS